MKFNKGKNNNNILTILKNIKIIMIETPPILAIFFSYFILRI